MSVLVLSWVFANSEATLSDRLVLLALADYAEDDGSKAFPSIEVLAEKARVSERTTQASLRKLERGGAIQPYSRTAGGITVYRIAMTAKAAKLEGVQDSRGADLGTKGVQDSTPRGADLRGAHIKEPSTNHQGNRVDADAPTAEEAPLSHLLADLIADNDPDGHRPAIGKRWATAERLLRDKDGRSPEQIELVIRWVQADSFWRSNVLSMGKLREKYPALVQKAMTERPDRNGSAASRADADIQRLEKLKQQIEKEEGKR